VNFSDQEMLKLALIAAGYENRFVALNTGRGPDESFEVPYYYTYGPWRTWNAYTDMADALALAIRLRLHVKIFLHRTAVSKPEICDFDEAHGEDADAATCRAIVRVAAHLGEKMLSREQLAQLFPHHYLAKQEAPR
jgi:hypothetical protein